MTNPKDAVGAKKAPLGLVPASAVTGPAPAMAVGAEKYGPFNWRQQKVQAMTYVEAALRHLYAWIDGQDNAEDTDISHISHVQAGLAILQDAIMSDNWIDNRPAKGPAADALRKLDKSQTSERKTVGSWMDVHYAERPVCSWAMTGEHQITCQFYRP